jgi:hypothetical protein
MRYKVEYLERYVSDREIEMKPKAIANYSSIPSRTKYIGKSFLSLESTGHRLFKLPNPLIFYTPNFLSE